MIALLLGSFNPIHKGHLDIAQYTLEHGLADEVWFVVSPQNPLKSTEELAPFEHRLEMVKLGTANIPRTKVSDIEASLPYPSYTINTLRKLYELYPQEQFIILAGSDIKDQLPLWREYKEIERLARFLIYPRGENHHNCSPEMANAPLINVDSTSCRAELYPPSERVRGWIPDSVIDYIHNNRLYNGMKNIEEYSMLIEAEENLEINLFERGQLYYKQGNFGNALNDFNATLRINPNHTKAEEMKKMVESILQFRHLEFYNA